jgi:hypothetical protein
MLLILCSFFAGITLFLVWKVFGPGIKDRWEAVWIWKVWPVCEHCRSLSGLALEDSRTLYHFEGKWDDPKNPNRPRLLCRECAEMHHEYWDGMWADYNSGRL